VMTGRPAAQGLMVWLWTAGRAGDRTHESGPAPRGRAALRRCYCSSRASSSIPVTVAALHQAAR
jgi:hypothetical protein